MKIRFQGLIVHAEVTGSDGQAAQVAVLMANAEHSPILNTPITAYRGGTATEIGTGTGVKCFALLDRVTNSAGIGTATVSLPRTPRIVDIRTGTNAIHPNIPDRTPHANFHAFVELPPGGTLTVEDFFRDEVTWGPSFSGCIGRTLLYNVPLSSDLTFTVQAHTGQAKTIILDKDADQIYITNRSNSCDHTVSHAEAYKLFFDPPETLYAVATTGTACRDGSDEAPRNKCTGEADLEVDCSNTRFP